MEDDNIGPDEPKLKSEFVSDHRESNPERNEKKVALETELEQIESKIKSLEVGIPVRFHHGTPGLTQILEDCANAEKLAKIQDRLERYTKKDCPISEEAFGWLGAANDNLAEFTRYITALEAGWWERKAEIEHELDNLDEPSQAEMNADENRYMEGQR